MYSSIFFRAVFSRSVFDRNSTTKSGQIGEKVSFSSLVSASQRSRRIQEASGERCAPLGSVKPADESKGKPLLSVSAQTVSRVVSLTLRFELIGPAGIMII